MKLEYIDEPDLEFGGGGRHIDIRAGLDRYGPLDRDLKTSPKIIRLGIVGTAQSVEGVSTWLRKCEAGIRAGEHRQRNLFPDFPGCTPDVGLRTSVIISSELSREIPARIIAHLIENNSHEYLIQESVNLFISEFRYIIENTNADVLVCAWPPDLLEAMEADIVGDDQSADQLDFHDLLKAKGMCLHKPIQVVRPSTYDPVFARTQKRRTDRPQTLQDEATRAWNFFTALYYKSGGIPWRLARDRAEFETCYVGISFYENLARTQLSTSMAQVFNQRGEGVVLRGGKARLSKNDRHPYLEASDSYDLLKLALDKYKEVHRHLPARISLHKTSQFHPEEIIGFTNAAHQRDIDLIDMMTITRTTSRVFRNGTYPPLRGTLLILDTSNHVLYSRGSVNYYATYPGSYVPLPLLVRYYEASKQKNFLSSEILALTKMNWNNTQFDATDPITIRAARQVGSILRYTNDHDSIEPKYSYYM